jgi:hypothetical protein
MRKFWLLIGLCVLLLGNAQLVSAREIRQGDQCRVPAREVIESDLFVLCRTLEIDGQVLGNIIGGATTAEINGSVAGNIYLFAGQLSLNGSVGGSVHFLGPAINIGNGTTFENLASDLISASLSTTIEPTAQIPDDVVAVGYQLVLNGNVADEVNYWGSALSVAGNIGGDINANVGDSESAGVAELQALLTFLPVSVTLERPGLRVAESASIGGLLSYTAPSPGAIDASLSQPPVYTEVNVQPELVEIAAITEPEDATRQIALYFNQVLREFLTLVLIGALALLLVPNALPAPLRSLSVRPLPSLGVGLLTFVVSFPVVAILLVLSALIIFALGLLQLGDMTWGSAVLLSALNLGLGSIFYFIAIFVSRAVVCLGLGRMIVRIVRPGLGGRNTAYVQLLIGAAVAALLFSLPTVGWIASAIAAFLGLGAILTLIQSNIEDRRRTPQVRMAAPVPLPSRSAEAHQFPPPMLDSGSRAPGMDNLPVGFRWWDD